MSSSPRKPHTRTNTAIFSNPITPIRNSTYDHPTFSPDHISPTKAAAQTKLNHEISIITSWLETLFTHQPVPAHLLKWREEVLASAALDVGLVSNDGFATPGRTKASGESVLEILRGWRQVNVAAEYLEQLVEAARREEFLKLKERLDEKERLREEGRLASVLFEEIEAQLSRDANEALNGLTDAVVRLGMDDGMVDDHKDVESVVIAGIARLQGQKIDLEGQLDRVRALQSELEAAQARQKRTEKQYSAHDEQTELINVQTAQYNRDGKQIAFSLSEHEDKIRGLQRQLAGQRESIDVNELFARKQSNAEKKKRIDVLQRHFAALHGLPADLEASKQEVQRSIDELEVLKARRQSLLEKIGPAQ